MWISNFFKYNKKETILVEILRDTEKSIKIKYGIYITYLPKSQIKISNSNKDKKVKVVLPQWLFRKKFE